MGRLVLIDGFNLLSRGYFATAYGKSEDQLSQTPEGLFTNALRVKLQKIISLVKEYEPTHFVVTWDVKRNEVKRKALYEDYKGTREDLPGPLIQQYETAVNLFKATGIPQMSVEGFEADDVMGTLSDRWTKEGRGDCYIYSNDRDLLQLLNPSVSQIIAIRKEGDKVYTEEHFKTEYGITPDQWIDVKALLGDKSDNIPGVAGVGDKAALPLIQQYGSVQGIYENIRELDSKFNRYRKKLIDGEELAKLSLELVTIERAIPELDDYSFANCTLDMDLDRFKDELDHLGLRIRM
ncbi:5'-3' exonuclease H3TH domain-containing protein [Anaerobacillus sp. 1_MG-2023]|uniref:5'-3' exonuclease n=1 Tax=Bacillales TaxID=1385 RepID=UPI0026E1F550|nr:5'-3' exonuclease H3TH domain-containing protein [Anaerobacillus sp. 1_MG-2023]MDO6655775.1 5'-3' exonuclease H3TH domain-containing protein [Anaerobacillus sp. 1_MG-2023]